MTIKRYEKISSIVKTIDSMQMLFDSPLANLYWKDLQGDYLHVNQTFLTNSAMNSEQEVIGKKDRQLAWHVQAETIEKNDQSIFLSGKSHVLIEYIKCTPISGIKTFISHKSPIKDFKGHIIGLFGLSYLIEDNLVINGDTHNNKFNLTQRQIDCLICLTQGMTQKQIGIKLNLSPKTVEHYIEAIKEKMNCRTRSELIKKGLQIPFIRNFLLAL